MLNNKLKVNYRSGWTINSQGYLLIYLPQHPFCDGKGYVRKHRLVMEKHIGRYLKPEEIVHHINENKLDNNINNLELFPNNSIHRRADHKGKKINTKELKIIKKLLINKKHKEISEILNISINTIRTAIYRGRLEYA